MQFVLSETLKNYMTEKGHENIVIYRRMRSCWSGSYAEVSAKFAKDAGNHQYEEYISDGFHIFAEPGIPFLKETITLDFEKLLFSEHIMIDGVPKF